MGLLYPPSSVRRLFLTVLILISFAQADEQMLGHNTRDKPQPIGIDFGAEAVFAMYAHSRTNVTVLGTVIPNETHHQRYPDMISIIRLQNEHRKDALHYTHGSGSKNVRQSLSDLLVTLRAIGKYHLSRIKLKAEPFFHSIVGDSITVPTWLKLILMFPINFIAEAAGDITSELLKIVSVLSQNPSGATSGLESFTNDVMKREFVAILEAVQFQAYETRRLRIDSAVISIPDYFNNTVRQILRAACREVGISASPLLERSVAAVPAVDHRPDSRMLIIDHGLYHLSISTFKANHDHTNNPIHERMIPLDTYASHSVDYWTTIRLQTKNKSVQESLRYGASFMKLGLAVRKARISIKDNLYAEASGLGADGDHHHDEWPLDLNDWGIGDGRTLTLQWEDVKAVEDDFAKGLTKHLSLFLIALRNGPLNRNIDVEGLPRQEIDTALILTDQPDGGLIRRAVREAVGDYVPIRGGYITNITLSAKGAAILAFRAEEQWEKMRLYDLGLGEEPVCDTGL